ncbi:MAG: MBG domain-containing protein [Isosphaeraceae bacterium]
MAGLGLRKRDSGDRIRANHCGRIRFVAEILESRRLPAALISEFPIRTLGGNPIDVAKGPDGNLWFTLANNIGKLTAGGGAVAQYPITTYNSGPTAIAPGPNDGNMWFLETASNAIGRISTSTGTITEYPLTTSANAGLRSLVAGPDGNIWFTEATTNRIGRLTPATGAIREFDAPQGAIPWGITSAGGALWYTMSGKNAIGKFSLDTLTTTTYTVSTASNLGLKGITAAADGTLWYTASVSNQVWTSTVSAPGSARSYSAGLSANAGLDRIAVASGGSGTYVYFAETAKSQVGVIAPNATTVAEIGLGANQSAPTGLAAAGDGNLYVAGAKANVLARLAVGSQAVDRVGFTATSGADPGDMVVGADGALWYTLPSSNAIGRFDPVTHFAQQFPLTLQSNLAAPMVIGPKGDLFFAEAGRYIGRFSTTTRSLVKEYTTGASNPKVAGLAYNPIDGYLWYTAPGAGAVYRLDMATGADTPVTVGISSGGSLGAITVTTKSGAAFDGYVWFAETTGKIGRIDPRSNPLQATEYAVPGRVPGLIYNAKVGKLWFSSGYAGNYIGTLDPANPSAGATTYRIPNHVQSGVSSYSVDLVATDDGRVWFTEGGEFGGLPYLESIDPQSGVLGDEITSGHYPQNLIASADGNVWYNAGGAPGTIGKILLSAASKPTQLAITVQPPASNSTTRGFGLVVSALNAAGQVATDYTGPITLTLLNNPANATLDGTLTEYAVNGSALFQGLTLNKPVSGYVLQATTPDLPSALVRTNPFDVANPATRLLVTAAPTSAVAGSPFVVQVSAQDDAGRVDPLFYEGITLTLLGGPAGAVLGGTRIVAADRGVATFGGLTIQQVGDGYTLVAGGTASVAPGTSDPFSVVPGALKGFVVTTSDPAPTAGSPFGVTVKAVDDYNNPIPRYTGTVTLTSDDPQARSLGSYAYQASDQGTHTFSVALNTAGARTVTAADGAASGAATATVAPAPAAGLAIAPASAGATAGVPLAVTVSALDAYGNIVPTYTGTVILGAGDLLATTPADYSFSAADKGRHAFHVTLRTPGSQTLTAADSANGLHAGGSVMVVANPTRTTLSATAASAFYGQSPVLQASVEATIPGGDPPGGLVQFYVNGQAIGAPVPLVGGRATSPSMAGLGAGAYPVTATYLGDGVSSGSNSLAPFTATIFKVRLLVQAADRSRTYGQADPDFDVTYSGFVGGEGPSVLSGKLTYTGLPGASAPASAYTITPGGLSSANYDVRFVPGKLAVAPAPLTITAPDVARVYGAGLPPGVAFRYDGFVNGETAANLQAAPVLASDAGPNSPAGGPYIVAASGASSTNYAIRYIPGNLTVTPAPLMVTAEASSTIYGSPIPRPSVRYDGLVAGDGPSSLGGSLVFLGGESGQPAGDYSLTPGGLASPNYVITYVPGALRINPAPLTIVADDLTKAAGAAVPTLTLRYIGLVNGDTPSSLAQRPSATTKAGASSGPGTYPIMLSGGASSIMRSPCNPAR